MSIFANIKADFKSLIQRFKSSAYNKILVLTNVGLLLSAFLIQYAHAGTYDGELLDGLPDGYGTSIDDNGNKYIGEWTRGKMHGLGIYLWSSGGKYIGEWRDGERHDLGIHLMANGVMYVGEWKRGERHGVGSILVPGVYKYSGGFKNGRENGRGVTIWSEGNKYIGNYRNGEQHGLGTHTWINGTSYEGEWQDGQKHGSGTYIYPNERKYVGTFSRDVMWKGVTYLNSGEEETIYSRGFPAKSCTDRKPVQSDGPSGAGTGFAVNPNYIVTAWHPFNCCKKLMIVRVDQGRCGVPVKAMLVGKDPSSDLALLRTDAAMKQHAVFSGNDSLRLGEFVANYGGVTPPPSCQMKMTAGEIQTTTWHDGDARLLAHTASTVPGSSGGPVFDRSGYIVGAVFGALEESPGTGTAKKDQFYAVKSHVIEKFLESHEIKFTKRKSSKKMRLSDIDNMATQFTVAIGCF